MSGLSGRRRVAGGVGCRGVVVVMAACLVVASCSSGPVEPTVFVEPPVSVEPTGSGEPSVSGESVGSTTEEFVAADESSAAASGEAGEVGEVTEVGCPEHLAGLGLRCVLVTVLMDRADPAAGTTAVSVAVRPGTGDGSLAPLAVLQGGPGGASSDLALVLASRPYGQVLIDQRGAGFGSARFWCHELLNELVDIIEATRDEADDIASQAAAECAGRLSSDPVFSHTTTDAHAADVVDVMAALGHDRWLLYGVSYGSTIALEVLRDAPVGLAGAVLDGVYPAHLDADAGVAAAADRAVGELDEACRADPVCSAIVAGADSGDGGGGAITGLLAALIARFNAEPMVVPLAAADTTMQEPIDALVDGDSVAVVVFQMLYDEFLATLVPAVVAGLARHDNTATAAGDDAASTAARLVAALGVEFASQQAHSAIPAIGAAVACAEWLPLASGPPPAISDFAAAVVGEGLAEHCEPWAIPASGLRTEPVRSDLPVLLISGWFDPITPPSLAEEASQHLPASTHIVSRTRGHGIWVWGYDSCVDGIVADFVAEPGTEVDTACTRQDRPLRWQPLA